MLVDQIFEGLSIFLGLKLGVFDSPLEPPVVNDTRGPVGTL